MAHLSLQSVFRAARPRSSAAATTTVRDPSVFLRRCRVSSPSASLSPSLRLPLPRNASNASYASARQRRCLSSTAGRPAARTLVVKNPRVDDEGNDMTIDISERAAKRLRQITSAAAAPRRRNTLTTVAAAPPQDSHLRVTVTSGGCHGFQYLMSLEGPSKIDEHEDTVFVAAEQDDQDGHRDGDGEGKDKESTGKAVVVMDEPSLELLKGSTVDFTTELIGSQFKIVGNPRATSSCGCGTSFDIA